MLNDNFVTFEIGKAKHIALVAHDGKKKELIEWCDKNKEILKGHFLCGCTCTATKIGLAAPVATVTGIILNVGFFIYLNRKEKAVTSPSS